MSNGLTLPFDVTVNSAATAFSVTNQGSGDGIVGTSTGFDGVAGLSHSPTHAGGSFSNDAGGLGVWARAATAGWFEGNVHVNGTIDTTGGVKFPDGSVQTRAFAGPAGPTGPTGPQGPAGPPGPQGAGIPTQVILGTAQGAGVIELLGSSGSRTVLLTYTSGAPNAGYIGATDAAGAAANFNKALMFVDAGGNGTIAATDSAGATASVYKAVVNGYGAFKIFDAANVNKAIVSILPATNSGVVAVADSAGTQLAKASMFADTNGYGYVTVTDAAGAAAKANKAMMYVDASGGHIMATGTKSFCVPHPNQSEMDITYSCIEGPEAAAYVRGTAHLVGGRCTIALPDHFVSVASPDNMTVQLTPLSSDSLGLAVVSKRVDTIEVRELHHGTGNYDIDWEVKSVRKGYEEYQVIRPRRHMEQPDMAQIP
jgi:hypothetical protein